jgi:hypothetical protein
LGAVTQKLMAMVRLNRTRMDYPERFQAMIDAYNAGSLNGRGVLHSTGGLHREFD